MGKDRAGAYYDIFSPPLALNEQTRFPGISALPLPLLFLKRCPLSRKTPQPLLPPSARGAIKQPAVSFFSLQLFPLLLLLLLAVVVVVVAANFQLLPFLLLLLAAARLEATALQLGSPSAILSPC